MIHKIKKAMVDAHHELMHACGMGETQSRRRKKTKKKKKKTSKKKRRY